MKRKILSLLILSFVVVSTSAPFLGKKEIIQENVVQTKHENQTLKDILHMSYVGIDKELFSPYETPKVKINFLKGWTTANVNIRSLPNKESEVLGVIQFNRNISYYEYDNEWVKIIINKQIGYISKQYISTKKCEFIDYELPNNNGFKSYMSYKAITDEGSQQYKLQEQTGYTGNYGIRQTNGRYHIAIGTYFNSSIGDYGELYLENGEIIPIIVADIKSNEHTDSNNISTKSNGCVSEFVVDNSCIDKEVKENGDVSVLDTWDSKVVKIRIYDKNILTKGEE